MVHQYTREVWLAGAGLALIVAALGQPAAAQTSNTNCYRIGNAVNCQTMTTGRPSAGSNVDWGALNQAANTIGSIPQAAQQGALAGYQLGQMAAIRSALRDVDINNPDSVNRAVGALVRAGSFDEARRLIALHNSLISRNAELAAPSPPAAPPNQIAEVKPSVADTPTIQLSPAPEVASQVRSRTSATAVPTAAAPASSPGYWLPGMPLPPQFQH